MMPMRLGTEFVKSVWHDVNFKKGFLGENFALEQASAINIQTAELEKMSDHNKKNILGKKLRSLSPQKNMHRSHVTTDSIEQS